ncbi:hypothetical protein MRB53_029915 [Persea americana]|uniref:Uncharacterized protein n=1 Tax=Persea americana TaxID=3435 RepID=A0ACC2KJQ8_PERAE|nr:hypothetical protein MRB53_029915 [Persea americana]
MPSSNPTFIAPVLAFDPQQTRRQKQTAAGPTCVSYVPPRLCRGADFEAVSESPNGVLPRGLIDLPWARGDLLNRCYVGESALSRGHVSGWCPSREGVTVNTGFQL